MIDAGIVAQLNANAAVSAVIAGRVFQDAVPPDMSQIPCVTYAFVGGSNTATGTTSGVFRQRVELNALAMTPEASKDLAGSVMQAFLNWEASLANGVRVLQSNCLNPGTDFVTEQRIFRRMVEFYVLYTLPAS